MTISRLLYSRRTEEWEAPWDLFDVLNREFLFTFDPCATGFNAKCAHFFTTKESGLAQDWSHHRVFRNPSYGREISKWMEKAREKAERGDLVVCLVHARTDTRWWHDHVEGIADEARFLRGRLSSEDPSSCLLLRVSRRVMIYRPHTDSGRMPLQAQLLPMKRSSSEESHA